MRPRPPRVLGERCGANGERSSTNRSIADLGRTSAFGKKFVNSIIREMAVLNDICSRSFVTALIVLCNMRFCSARRLDGLHGGIELHGFGPVVDDHPPGAIQEAADAADAVHAPRLDGLQRAHEHLVQPQGVGPVFPHDFVGIDHVAAAFRHLIARLSIFTVGSAFRTNPSPCFSTASVLSFSVVSGWPPCFSTACRRRLRPRPELTQRPSSVCSR